MNLNNEYSKLAAQLGDVEFKLIKLNAAKATLLQQIEQLNSMAAAEEASKAKAMQDKAELAEKLKMVAPQGERNEKKSSPNNAARGGSTP